MLKIIERGFTVGFDSNQFYFGSYVLRYGNQELRICFSIIMSARVFQLNNSTRWMQNINRVYI